MPLRSNNLIILGALEEYCLLMYCSCVRGGLVETLTNLVKKSVILVNLPTSYFISHFSSLLIVANRPFSLNSTLNSLSIPAEHLSFLISAVNTTKSRLIENYCAC